MLGRRHPRYPARFNIFCEFRGVRHEIEAINLSRGGLLVVATDVLEVGSLVKLRFSLGNAGEIELKGLVRHVAEEKGCGVEFIELLPKQQLRLGAYLKKVSAEEAEVTD